MKSKTYAYLISLCLALIGLLATATAAQEKPAQAADPERERVEKLIRQAWQEADQFVKSGKKESDADYPGRKWAAVLWQYRQEHPGAPAAAQARAEALHLLVHADQISEVIAKADSLKPDDAAWKRVLSVLLEAANKKKDYDYLIGKLQFLLQHSPDREVKVRAQFTLGQAYWKKGENEPARTAFQKVIADYPNTAHAKEAEGNLHEIDSLNLGQPAPQFAYKASGGEPVVLSDYKGKVVLLNFWASW